MSYASYRGADRATGRLRSAAGRVLTLARQRGAPAVTHIRDHGYSIAGLACFDSAWFMHSVFAGLIATAGSFLILEWKVQE